MPDDDSTPATPTPLPSAPAAEPIEGAADETLQPVFGPPVPPPLVRPRRADKRPWIAAFLALVLIGSIFAATAFELDYYAYKPGAMREIEPLLDVDGAETFAPDGSISFTTVSLERVNFIELIQGWIDDDVDIHEAEEVLQGRDSDENRRFNMALMTTAQQVATEVALTKLGYEVEGIDGYTVFQVEDGSAADGVLELGDTIVAVDGERIDDLEDRDRLLGGNAPGEELALTVRHFTETEEEQVNVTLGASPDDPDRGIMGVMISPIGVRFEVDVRFDTGRVGGPSAGLAMTLALIDEMTPGDLTGGLDVAVTGTIEPDGTVGPIGGAGQKAAAVRRAGGDVFLVPSADYDAATKRAGDVEIVEVDSLDEALAALERLGGDPVDFPTSASSPTP